MEVRELIPWNCKFYVLQNEVKYFVCLKLKKSYFLNPSERHLHHFLLLLQLLQIMGFERGSWQRLAEDVVHRGRPEPGPTSQEYVTYCALKQRFTFFIALSF